MGNEIPSIVQDTFSNMAVQLIMFALLITAAYVLTYIILRALKVPIVLTKPISAVVMLFTMYYSFTEIFIP